MASQTSDVSTAGRRARTFAARIPSVVDDYQVDATGVYHPPTPVSFQSDDDGDMHFETLLNMQQRHFWYRGRQRFIAKSLRTALGSRQPGMLSAIDLGGGCGGWVRHLSERGGAKFGELALADSSLKALQMAADVVPPSAKRYQIDLLNLQWGNRWDVAFLLDVLEHIDDHERALREIRDSLRPGGLLVITVPALQFFWSWNDAAVGHHRRYARRDFRPLAQRAGLEIVDSRYFMFLLSPLLLAQRMTNGARSKNLSDAERKTLIEKSHLTPAAPLNTALTTVFGAETPLGHWLPFPWGTSLLAVLRKPL